MEWSDTGIILTKINHSDSLTVISCMTKKRGLRKGAIKNSKSNQQLAYPGNISDLTWRGRLEEHLGHFNVKSCESIYPYVYHSHYKMIALLSSCSLLDICLGEKEPQEDLYYSLEKFIYSIKFTNDQWLKDIVFLELDLLSKLGFGLDLAKCAVSESSENLIYLSPKTGRAVSQSVGEPYKDRLFKLPKIFIDYEYSPSVAEISYALEITQHFLQKYITHLKGCDLPQIRSRLQFVLQDIKITSE